MPRVKGSFQGYSEAFLLSSHLPVCGARFELRAPGFSGNGRGPCLRRGAMFGHLCPGLTLFEVGLGWP